MVLVAVRRSLCAAVASAVLLAGCGGVGPPSSSPTTPAVITPTPSSVPSTPTPTSAAIGVSAGSILGSLPAEPAGTTWVRISDPSAPFTFEVPTAWSATAAGPWEEGGMTIGYVLAGATDASKLGTDFSASGVVIGVSADPMGVTPRAVAEQDDHSSSCTATPTQEVSDPAFQAAYRAWESCGPAGTGFLLAMAIAPADGGLVGVIFQGATQSDLGYIERVLSSLQPVASLTPTPGQATTPPGTHGLYSLTLDLCQNQHGQGVAEGIITNQDAANHAFRVRVRFYDPNGVLLNDADSYATPELRPGESFRWQSVVPSGLPSVNVACEVSQVEIVF